MKIAFYEAYRIPDDQEIVPFVFFLLPSISLSISRGILQSVNIAWLWWQIIFHDFMGSE
jgi:hypothetical protein